MNEMIEFPSFLFKDGCSGFRLFKIQIYHDISPFLAVIESFIPKNINQSPWTTMINVFLFRCMG